MCDDGRTTCGFLGWFLCAFPQMAAPCLPSAFQAPTLSLLWCPCWRFVTCLLVTEAVTLGWPLLHDTRLTSSWDVTLRLTLHFHRHLLTRDFFLSLWLWQSRLGTLSASHSLSASGLFEAPVNLSVIRTFSYTPPTRFGCLHLCTPHWTVLAELSPALLPKSTAWLTASLPPTL